MTIFFVWIVYLLKIIPDPTSVVPKNIPDPTSVGPIKIPDPTSVVPAI